MQTPSTRALVRRQRDEYVTNLASVIARCFDLDAIREAFENLDPGDESRDTLWCAMVMTQTQ